MQFIELIKRNLRSVFVAGAVVLSCALVLGGPLLRVIPVSAKDQPQQQQPSRQQSPARTFVGTVVKAGGNYAFEDAFGQSCKLDEPKRVRPYEGKKVKITGQLDERTLVIHVETIAASED